MMSFEALYPQFEVMIDGLAFEFGGKGRRFGADPSDFRQEFIIWLIEHIDAVEEWTEERGPEETEKLVAKSLRNEGLDYLLDIKAQATGYERQDNYFYSKGELKELLGSVYDPEKWHEPPQSDGGRSSKAPAEGGNWVAMLADISRAISALEKEDRAVLEGIHRDGWTNRMMAEAAGVSESLMSYRHGRALTRLSRELGGEAPEMREQTTRDPWRGRRAVSNASARAYQSGTYDE